LTFTRRAAVEMERRAGQILSRVLGGGRMRRSPELAWAGTFHSVGARLLREYAPRIGLHTSLTILDRGDAEDLVALVRHELGVSATEKPFPAAGTGLAIYSRVINGEAPVGDAVKAMFPWCAGWEAELKKLFTSYVEAKQKQNVLDYDDLLFDWLRCSRGRRWCGRSARAALECRRWLYPVGHGDWDDATELLGVDMQQIPRISVLAAKQRRAGLEIGEARQPCVGEHTTYRRCQDTDAARDARPGRPTRQRLGALRPQNKGTLLARPSVP
jgi:UvrD/REP helicase N-terminal domain